MKFESQRLCFRELADGDIENLSQLLKDPKVMEYCEGALDYEASQRWLKSVQKYYKSLGYDYWAAVHKESGQFLGQMGIIKQEVDGEWIDCVAFMVNSKEWGKGYATEGAGACIEYAFDVLNHRKIYATVEKENLASKKVIEKLGMKYERDVMCFNKKVELYSVKKANQRAVILLHEIYGINDHIRSKCDELSAEGYDVFCPSLLSEDRVYTYEQEEEAYCNFVETLGVEAAYNKTVQMYQQIEKKYNAIYVVGYSVGATLAWRIGAEYQVAGIVCFYGSRIRDYVQLTPRSPVLMFFALEEKGFDVIALADCLKLKEAVTSIEIYKAFHGFADPYNKSYREEYAKDANGKMKRFLQG